MYTISTETQQVKSTALNNMLCTVYTSADVPYRQFAQSVINSMPPRARFGWEFRCFISLFNKLQLTPHQTLASVNVACAFKALAILKCNSMAVNALMRLNIVRMLHVVSLFKSAAIDRSHHLLFHPKRASPFMNNNANVSARVNGGLEGLVEKLHVPITE